MSPLDSFCSVTTRSTPSFHDALRSIWRWWRGTRPSFRQQVMEAKIVEAIAAEHGGAEAAEPKHQR
jgi:hypothetical protein